jgi:hypothetical protein
MFDFLIIFVSQNPLVVELIFVLLQLRVLAVVLIVVVFKSNDIVLVYKHGVLELS